MYAVKTVVFVFFYFLSIHFMPPVGNMGDGAMAHLRRNGGSS